MIGERHGGETSASKTSSRLKWAVRLSPLKLAGTAVIDELEIQVRPTLVSEVTVPTIVPPAMTGDLCPPFPYFSEQDYLLQAPPIVDLTAWLSENLACLISDDMHWALGGVEQSEPWFPLVETGSMDLTSWIVNQFDQPVIERVQLLERPQKAGKRYNSDKADTQIPLFTDEQETCVHGLRKGWCRTCQENERAKMARQLGSKINVFDLILPLLQPPLGDNFDNPVAFGPGLKLYPFQCKGVEFLLEHDVALLGDEMGLGKSIQVIVGIKMLVRLGRAEKGLIVCPRSILSDWHKKIREWAPELLVNRIHGPKEQRQLAWASPAHIYLTTYETLRQDLSGSLELSSGEQDIARHSFDFAVVDEIQRIKNPAASVTKAMRLITPRIRWGLSGTPLENRVEELVSVFSYLKPGLLHYDIASAISVKRAIAPYFLRRRKKEALPDLPEKHHEKAWLDLLPQQRLAYERAKAEGTGQLRSLGQNVTAQHIFSLMTNLKQICNFETHSRQSCKLEYLIEKLEEISEIDSKALVFSQYPIKTFSQIIEELRAFRPLVYDGSLTESERTAVLDRFKQDNDCRVLLMSVKAGALGLTLTEATYVFHFDLWWNPAVATQAEDRAHRIGQHKTVFVESLLTENTIEEDIEVILENKRKLFSDTIDDLTDSAISTGMTDQELFGLTEQELFGLFGLEKPSRNVEPPPRASGKAVGLSVESVSPQQFEQMVADLYRRMGYGVQLTAQSRDQGVDVYAKRISEAGTDYLAIQCKHYPKGVVGVEHVRSLYGVMQDQPGITRGVLITSGEFSRECRQFAQGKRIELFDGKYLGALLVRHGVLSNLPG